MSADQSSQASPVPPFRFAGGNLGIADGREPFIYLVDAKGQRWLTRSVEAVLRSASDFTGDEQSETQLLASAALHYGLDVWALIDGYGSSVNTDLNWDSAAAKIGGAL